MKPFIRQCARKAADPARRPCRKAYSQTKATLASHADSGFRLFATAICLSYVAAKLISLQLISLIIGRKNTFFVFCHRSAQFRPIRLHNQCCGRPRASPMPLTGAILAATLRTRHVASPHATRRGDGKWPSVAAPVDDIDAQGGKATGECIFRMERLAEAKTRRDGSDDRNQ